MQSEHWNGGDHNRIDANDSDNDADEKTIDRLDEPQRVRQMQSNIGRSWER